MVDWHEFGGGVAEEEPTTMTAMVEGKVGAVLEGVTAIQQQVRKCHWKFDPRSNGHVTGCGHRLRLEYGAADENGMVYCCFCAKPLTRTDVSK